MTDSLWSNLDGLAVGPSVTDGCKTSKKWENVRLLEEGHVGLATDFVPISAAPPQPMAHILRLRRRGGGGQRNWRLQHHFFSGVRMSSRL